MTFPSVLLRVLLAEVPPLSVIDRRYHGAPPSAELLLSDIVYDSREAREGTLFVALPGAHRDGHDFIPMAYRRNVRLFAIQQGVFREEELPPDALFLVYENTRAALALLSQAFFGHPERDLTLVGITGTKGKTTTAFLAHSLLKEAGIPTGYIGTCGVFYRDTYRETVNTTPESYVLARTFYEMRKAGITTVMLEVSSQALAHYRVFGLTFDTVLFTNLSPDHIGPYEHPTFESYRAAKRSLFSEYGATHLILNADDGNAAEMLSARIPSEAIFLKGFSPENMHGNAVFSAKMLQNQQINATVRTFSADPRKAILPPDIIASLPKAVALRRTPDTEALGITFSVSEAAQREGASPIAHVISLAIPGLYNVYNALGVLEIGKRFGLSTAQMAKILPTLAIPGRCEALPAPKGCKNRPILDESEGKMGISAPKNMRILIDYAHNRASLEAVLTTLRTYHPTKLTVLFGSVGGRTEGRRREMGEVASRLADFVILTSDNPDFEDEMQIIKDIAAGFERDVPHVRIPDRQKAITYALSHLEEGEILLLAGKGHETYQLKNGKKLPFSEREIVLGCYTKTP